MMNRHTMKTWEDVTKLASTDDDIRLDLIDEILVDSIDSIALKYNTTGLTIIKWLTAAVDKVDYDKLKEKCNGRNVAVLLQYMYNTGPYPSIFDIAYDHDKQISDINALVKRNEFEISDGDIDLQLRLFSKILDCGIHTVVLRNGISKEYVLNWMLNVQDNISKFLLDGLLGIAFERTHDLELAKLMNQYFYKEKNDGDR